MADKENRNRPLRINRFSHSCVSNDIAGSSDVPNLRRSMKKTEVQKPLVRSRSTCAAGK